MAAFVDNNDGIIRFGKEAPDWAMEIHTGFSQDGKSLMEEKAFVARHAARRDGELCVPGIADDLSAVQQQHKIVEFNRLLAYADDPELAARRERPRTWEDEGIARERKNKRGIGIPF